MVRAIGWTLALALLACSGSLSAHAKAKRAFVVGIDNYVNLSADRQLKRAVGDAVAVKGALETLGFRIVLETNPTRSSFNRRWQDFLNTVEKGDEVALVFAGHGFEINGTNFLVPSDVPGIQFGRDEQLKRETISLQELINDLHERRPAFTLMIIDACRENPFVEGERFAVARGGLARVGDPPEGIFIMFSAGARQVALDRLPENDNFTTSVYMRALVPLLTTPGLNLLNLADQVAQHVRDTTATVWHRQTPAFYSGVVGASSICLAGCMASLPAKPPTDSKPQTGTPTDGNAAPPPAPATRRSFAGEWLVTTRWTSGCTNPGRSMKILVNSSGRITDAWLSDEKGNQTASIMNRIRSATISENGRLALSYAIVPRRGEPEHLNILEGDISSGSGRARSERDGKMIGCAGFFSITALGPPAANAAIPEKKAPALRSKTADEPKPARKLESSQRSAEWCRANERAKRLGEQCRIPSQTVGPCIIDNRFLEAYTAAVVRCVQGL